MMPCIATAALAASLTMASAVASPGELAACAVIGSGAPGVTRWLASANGVEVERLDVLALPSIGWAEWPRRHPVPAPMSVAEAVSRLEPGLLVVTWR
jgi:hypothetical protein